MGVGVAQRLAEVNYNVTVVDISQTILEAARRALSDALRVSSMFGRAPLEITRETILNSVAFTTDYEALRGVSFVIENATEDLSIKQQVYQLLDSVCDADCVIAANTSAIPITRLGSFTKRPGNVVGIHFMNPVALKATVELIRGYHTTNLAVEAARSVLKRMGKQWIEVNDSPGFVSNRVLMLTISEAAFLVYEGVATAEDVDAIFRGCFGHKMGPLETADLIGVDTVLRSIQVLFDSFQDPKFRPCPLLSKMTQAGLLGRKTGQGFYNYSGTNR